jgi:MFS family permease
MFSLAAAVMAWAPTVHALIVGRLLVGYAIGLAATVAPILISESSPAEIRGQLATLPQLMGSLGLVLAYAMNFALSLQPDPDWRIMLGSLFVPSLVYVLLGIFVLPESPRWLVSKGRMLDAKLVLQNLRGQEDVSGTYYFVACFSLSIYPPSPTCICIHTNYKNVVHPISGNMRNSVQSVLKTSSSIIKTLL